MITIIAIVVALSSLLHPLDLLVRKEYRVRPEPRVQWVRLDRLATLDQLVPDPLDLKAFKVFKVIQDRLDHLATQDQLAPDPLDLKAFKV
jgi:hypothetical protein